MKKKQKTIKVNGVTFNLVEDNGYKQAFKFGGSNFPLGLLAIDPKRKQDAIHKGTKGQATG